MSTSFFLDRPPAQENQKKKCETYKECPRSPNMCLYIFLHQEIGEEWPEWRAECFFAIKDLGGYLSNSWFVRWPVNPSCLRN